MNEITEKYRHLDHQFDCGDCIHPEVARREYGFPELTTPGTQVYVVPIPEGVDVSENNGMRLLIWQAKQHKNSNRSWVRLPSYAGTVERAEGQEV